MKMKYGFMAAIAAFAATVASAASITIDRVAQRWPWNNKVDIYYTVDGAQDVKGSTFARIEFTANIGGTEKTIDGNAIGASASDGEHVATWTAPAGLRASDCTMTARLVASDAPSGDDYMIVNLSNGAVTYEGLLASPDDSNARYNTEEYKTGKMVLRKIPRWADRASLRMPPRSPPPAIRRVTTQTMQIKTPRRTGQRNAPTTLAFSLSRRTNIKTSTDLIRLGTKITLRKAI